MKEAIELISKVPEFADIDGRKQQPTEPAMEVFVSAMLSALVVMPGHPEHGAFYLLKQVRLSCVLFVRLLSY